MLQGLGSYQSFLARSPVGQVGGEAEATRTVEVADSRKLIDWLSEVLAACLDIYVTDRSGVIRCTADPWSEGVDISGRPQVRNALASANFAIGGYFVRRTDTRPVLSFGLPYIDA